MVAFLGCHYAAWAQEEHPPMGFVYFVTAKHGGAAKWSISNRGLLNRLANEIIVCGFLFSLATAVRPAPEVHFGGIFVSLAVGISYFYPIAIKLKYSRGPKLSSFQAPKRRAQKPPACSKWQGIDTKRIHMQKQVRVLTMIPCI